MKSGGGGRWSCMMEEGDLSFFFQKLYFIVTSILRGDSLTKNPTHSSRTLQFLDGSPLTWARLMFVKHHISLFPCRPDATTKQELCVLQTVLCSTVPLWFVNTGERVTNLPPYCASTVQELWIWRNVTFNMVDGFSVQLGNIRRFWTLHG